MQSIEFKYGYHIFFFFCRNIDVRLDVATGEQKKGTFYFKRMTTPLEEREIEEDLFRNGDQNERLKTKLIFSFYMCTFQNCVVLP